MKRRDIEAQTRRSVAFLINTEVQMERYPVGYNARDLRVWRVMMTELARSILIGTPKEGQCCQWEKRNMNGGCDHCGDPCV